MSEDNGSGTYHTVETKRIDGELKVGYREHKTVGPRNDNVINDEDMELVIEVRFRTFGKRSQVERRVDTFKAMGQGGGSGPLGVVYNALHSSWPENDLVVSLVAIHPLQQEGNNGNNGSTSPDTD